MLVRGNKTLKRRAALRWGILAGILLLLCLPLFLVSRSETVREVARARAILNDAARQPKQDIALTPAPDKPAPTIIDDSRPGLDTVIAWRDQEGNHQPARVGDPYPALWPRLSARPPWFAKKTLDDVADGIKLMRDRGQARPEDDALDPAKHSPDEIHKAVCDRVRESPVNKGLRASTHRSSQHSYTDMASGEARSRLTTCLACEIAYGQIDTAVPLFVESCKYGTPFSWDILPPLFDMFPGAVPDDAARRLVEAIDTSSVSAEAWKTELQRVNAAAVQDNYEQSLHEAWEKLSWPLFDVRGGFRRLSATPQTQGILQITDQALKLADLPPYQTEAAFADLDRSIPTTAEKTRYRLHDIQHCCGIRHANAAMAAVTHTAIALKKYKAEHGGYPASLDGLSPDPIPALPLNPFTGKPMVYARVDDGFEIGPETQENGLATLLLSWKAMR